MKVAIINITKGGMSGGYKKYILNVIPRLSSNSNIQSVLCISPGALHMDAWFGFFPNVEFMNCSPFDFLPGLTGTLKHKLTQFSPDVIFIPVERYFHFNKVPVVNMLQNMEPFVSAEMDSSVLGLAQRWFRVYLAKRGIAKADRVIAISKFVKEFLMNNCGLAENKIGLVYYGIDSFKQISPLKPERLPISLDNGFIFTAGSIRPTRGLEDVILALNYLDKNKGWPLKLVIAGSTNPNMAAYKTKLKGWIKKLGIADKVYWSGYLNEKEMAWCYKNCKLFIMSSRVESFGRIALEAMSYGCICISADNPCLPEIFKDGAIYYPPKDSEFLAGCIKSVLSFDSRQKEEMIARAKNRAGDFSWEMCVNKTVEELIMAAGVKH
jgi:glycosyltransferase involved in cell wall biosynthesis